MKKFLSIVLAAAMVMAMSVTAFAGEKTFDALPDSQDIDVYIRLDTDGDGIPDLRDDTPLGESICIDLAWPDVVEFIYSMEWDSSVGEFVNLEWQESDMNITITNRSTVGVTAVLSYNNREGFDYDLVFEGTELNNATFDSETNTVVLENPADSTNVVLDKDEGSNNIMPYAVIEVTLGADPAIPSEDSDVPVGTITVTITATAEESQVQDAITIEADSYNNSGYTFTVARNRNIPVTLSTTYSGFGNMTTGSSIVSASGAGNTYQQGTDFTWDATTGTFAIINTSVTTMEVTWESMSSGGEMPVAVRWTATLTVVDATT